MKKKKKISALMIFLALVLIVTGYSILFINDYTADAEETIFSASIIKNNYKPNNIDLEKISREIKDVGIFDVKYYNQVKKNYNKNIEELRIIEKHIQNVESTSKNILYQCDIMDYNDYDIDNKCDTIAYNYESIINAYVSMVNKYNEVIDGYNEWNTKDALEKYKPSNYSDYVDINLDGVFSGVIK